MAKQIDLEAVIETAIMDIDEDMAETIKRLCDEVPALGAWVQYLCEMHGIVSEEYVTGAVVGSTITVRILRTLEDVEKLEEAFGDG